MDLFQVVTVTAAWSKLWQYIQQPQRATEQIPLAEALGRVLAQDVIAPLAVPGFKRSTIDGYAVRAKDTFGASESLPALITVVGEVLMGQEAKLALEPGQGVQIATGGMLPPGSDAAVMIEYTEELDSTTVAILRSVAPGENVIQAGEDVRAGEQVLPIGQQLRPQDLGVLAGVGVVAPAVFARPKVGIISTGDELVDPSQLPLPGQVRDINSYTLYGLVQASGGQGKLYGIIVDDYQELYRQVALALAENDIVVISGGSSVGTRDATAKVIAALGEPGVLVHGVSVRPGKPTIIGVIGAKPVFGLPGHPVSAMVIFDLLIKPVINHFQGLRPGQPVAMLKARVSQNVASGPGREDHVRVVLEQRTDQGVWAVPVLGKAGLITTMVKADGIFCIPLDKEGVMLGETVEVRLF